MIGRKPQLVLIPALALILTSCHGDGVETPEPDPDYVAVCTDPRTSLRVDDDQCDDAPEYYTGTSGLDTYSSVMWFYMPTTGTHTAPPIGHRVSAGAYTTPAAAGGARTPVVARSGAVPTSGGQVVRGGFGAALGKSGGG